MSKPIASLSLDLDNKWSYLKNYGDESWEQYPSYYPVFVPHALHLFEELNLKVTFFLVGRDLEIKSHHQYIRMIVEKGHDIGNHSHNHDTWLHQYNEQELRNEIDRSHKIITAISGKIPLGFRGPGFTYNNTLHKILSEKGYRYDSSSFPTFIGPLARWYYMKNSKLTSEQKLARKSLFGSFRDGFKKLKPYVLNLDNRNSLLEIPVTTMPILRLPVHMTYLLYLGMFSSGLMMLYLNTAINLCKLTRTRPCFLIHPTDLMGYDLIPDMGFFPGMKMKTGKKVELFIKVINQLRKHFNLKTMGAYADEIYLSKKPYRTKALSAAAELSDTNIVE